MEFITTPFRVVNRDGKTYTADNKGIIIADTKEIEAVFIAYGFSKKDKPTSEDKNEVVLNKPKKTRKC